MIPPSDPVSPVAPRWRLRTEPERPDLATGVFHVVEIDDFIVSARFEATAARTDVADWPLITMQIEMHGSRPVIRALTITGQTDDADGSVAPADSAEEPPTRASRPINSTLLRELPLGQLAKHAMLGVAWRIGEGNSGGPVVGPGLRDDAGFYEIGPDTVEEHYLGHYRPGRDVIPADASVYSIDHEWEDPWDAHMQALAAAIIDRQPPPTRRNRVTRLRLRQVAQVYREAIKNNLHPKQEVSTHFGVAEATAGRWIGRARKLGFLGPTLPGKKGELETQQPG